MGKTTLITTSVVVPVFNGYDVTRQCIDALYGSTGVDLEVIAVDNASTDGVSDWLQEQASTRPSFTLVANDRNLGFARAVNQGAEVARGEYLVVANNDVYTSTTALQRLATHLAEDERIGAVGPVTNYVGHGPQLDRHARAVTPDSLEEYARSIVGRPGRDRIAVVDRLVFFFVAMRTNTFLDLGGLSDDFGLGNFEDEEFCLRLKLAGQGLVVDPRAFVYHVGSHSWKARGLAHDWWMRRNRKIFLEKAATYSLKQPPYFTRSDTTARDASVILRTLDRPDMLRQALTSLANQTYRDFEVIVVNDGGSDVANVISDFEHCFPVALLNNPAPTGRAAALNRGIDEAVGRFLTYLDDDDILYPTHLEHLVSLLKGTDTDLAYTGVNKALYEPCDTEERLLLTEPSLPMTFDVDNLFLRNCLPLHSVMHTARSMDAVGRFDGWFDLMEDWELWIRISQRFKIAKTESCTCEYRFRLGTITNATLTQRAQMFVVQGRVYERHPAPSRRLARLRAAERQGFETQISRLKSIEAAFLPAREKQLLVLAETMGFDVTTMSGARVPPPMWTDRSLEEALKAGWLARASGRGFATARRNPVTRWAGRWLANHSNVAGRVVERARRNASS